MSACSSCGKAPSGTALLTCSGCGDAHYCDDKCQRAHWKVHRGPCKSKRAELETEDRYRLTPAAAAALEPVRVKASRVDITAVIQRLTAARDPGTKLADVVDALRRAASPAADATIADIVASGGASLVVEIMSGRSRNSNVAEWGCAALQTLARVSPAVVDAVTDAGGAVAAVAALDAHGASEDAVASAGCAALCHMCGGSGRARTAVFSAGGPRAVTAALLSHYASSSGGNVVRNAVNFFQWLCRPEDQAGAVAAATACIAAGCIPALVAVLRVRKAERFVQTAVPDVLKFFSVTSPANREAVRAAAGAEFCL